MKNLLIGLLVIFAFVAGIFVSQNYNFKIETKNPIPTKIIESPSPADILVGNDSDEHGCKNSAGYTWCEAKNKCLRIWEEKCEEENNEDKIKEAILVKHGWKNDEVNITISKSDETFARGGIKEINAVGGGMFLAKKINGKWEIVFEGNGTPDCNQLKETYSFPKELLIGVCD